MKKYSILSSIIALIFITMSSCMADKNPQQAWWLDLSVTPDKTELNDLNVRIFDKSWRYAIFLDETTLKKHINNKQLSELTTSNFILTSSIDLNRNKKKETLKVGVYEKDNGTGGIFLAIFEDSKLLKVFSDSSNKGFSAIIQSENNIRWYKCMNCGEYEIIRWNGRAYTIE